MPQYKSTMLFDVMKNILVTKSEKLYEQHISDPNFKDFTGFICRKYMTMSPSEEVRRIVLDSYASLERMTDPVLYRWLMRNLPAQNSGFIQFIR